MCLDEFPLAGSCRQKFTHFRHIPIFTRVAHSIFVRGIYLKQSHNISLCFVAVLPGQNGTLQMDAYIFIWFDFRFVCLRILGIFEIEWIVDISF